MELFVGTSGWFYSWNPDGSFDWFSRFSGLNAVELNMSFYKKARQESLRFLTVG
jgi:uncharacterized protein YecE (DUF72 family)